MSLCQCGCGKETKIINVTITRLGYKKGDYFKFIKGHKPNKKLIIHCENCNKNIVRKLSHAVKNKNNFCSINCHNKFQIGKESTTKGKPHYWNKGENNSSKRPEVREKLRNAMLDREIRPEWREKIRKFHLGKKHSEETKEKIRISLKNRILTEEHKRKIGLANKGKKLSEETKRKLSEVNWSRTDKREEIIKKITTPQMREKQRQRKLKEWKDPVFRERTIQKVVEAITRRPTSYETELNKILIKLQPNEWKYTGDGSFLIGYKNPDFVNVNGKKICIEVFHSYYKKRGFGTVENYKKIRTEQFLKFGWNTIFIDETQLNEESVKNLLIDKKVVG